jgi:hypothetical protein
VYVLEIDGVTLRLRVGTDVATQGGRTLVEGEGAPVEIAEELLYCTVDETRAVSVFDAEKALALVLAGEDIVV